MNNMIKTRYNRKQLDLRIRYLKSLGATVNQQGYNYYAELNGETIMTAKGSYAGYSIEIDKRYQHISKK